MISNPSGRLARGVGALAVCVGRLAVCETAGGGMNDISGEAE